jgi:hypothetical protein
MTYAELHSLIRGKNNKSRRKIAGNTWGEIDPVTGMITVTFHKTHIIRAFPSGSFVLNNGGYQTVTTKRRLNQFTPFSVWQRNFTWFTRENGRDVEFQNGMLLVW